MTTTTVSTGHLSEAVEMRCLLCDRAARFLTPEGVMCPTHALLTAIAHQSAPHAEAWMPILLNQPDGAFDRDLGRPPHRMTVSA
jgi:hypothetical protein